MKKTLIAILTLLLCLGVLFSFAACKKEPEPKYTVTWKVEGTIVETDSETTKDSKPSFDAAAPTKTGTAQYSYAFAGWGTSEAQETGLQAAELAAVTADVTYYALFTKTTNSYEVKWAITSENILETDADALYGTAPSFDAAVPTKAATAQYSYSFAGWATSEAQETGSQVAELSTVTAAVTYYAAFTKTTNSYNVRWAVTSENILETDADVLYGAAPSFDAAEPTREATAQYTFDAFTGWSTEPDQETGVAASELPAVEGEVTYYAAFSRTIRCYNLWWSQWRTDEWGTGTRVIISYHSSNGTAVPYGTSPLPYDMPEPTKAGDQQNAYTFVGWSTDAVDANIGRNYCPYDELPPITRDTHYYATFTKSVRTYTVLWKSYDGSTVYETDENVAFGTQMSFDQPNPTMEGYTFKGWSFHHHMDTGEAAPYANTLNANAETGIVTVYAAFEPNEV